MLFIVLALVGLAGLAGSVAIAAYARKKDDKDSKKGAVLVGVFGAFFLLIAVVNWLDAKSWDSSRAALYGFGFCVCTAALGWGVPTLGGLVIVGLLGKSSPKHKRRRPRDADD
jgi:hypothetical protein